MFCINLKTCPTKRHNETVGGLPSFASLERTESISGLATYREDSSEEEDHSESQLAVLGSAPRVKAAPLTFDFWSGSGSAAYLIP